MFYLRSPSGAASVIPHRIRLITECGDVGDRLELHLFFLSWCAFYLLLLLVFYPIKLLQNPSQSYYWKRVETEIPDEWALSVAACCHSAGTCSTECWEAAPPSGRGKSVICHCHDVFCKKRCELFNLLHVLRNFFSYLCFQPVTESLVMFEAAENKAEKGLWAAVIVHLFGYNSQSLTAKHSGWDCCADGEVFSIFLFI